MDKDQLERLVKQFVATDARNAIPEIPGLAIFQEPLIAYASADDPIYDQLKLEGVIGSHHLSPAEWLSGARSVISWFLPLSKEIVVSNREEGLPSKEWYLGRWWGEVLNDALRNYVVGEITKSGRSAVAPPISDRFSLSHDSSNWSERHSAYIAGLGTFSLSYSFITERGCAGRFGSVITDIEFAASERTAGSLMENCIHDEEGTCGICIGRCPGAAISAERKDHTACIMYVAENILSAYPQQYDGIFIAGCGKCQTAVPCARTNPNKKTRKTKLEEQAVSAE